MRKITISEPPQAGCQPAYILGNHGSLEYIGWLYKYYVHPCIYIIHYKKIWGGIPDKIDSLSSHVVWNEAVAVH